MASPSQNIHPLRISKGSGSSPAKVGSSLPRALTELAPTEQRRNSPTSFHQPTKKMSLTVESSPFQSSPFNTSIGDSSPRLFWQGRDPAAPGRFNSENAFGRESSPSPTRRSSIERLQKASRVKNSSMFAREQKQEYDPASVPVVERPLAKVQGNAYGASGIEGLRSARPVHSRTESNSSIPLYSPTKTPVQVTTNATRSPSKTQLSPTKSSLSSRYNGKNSSNSEMSVLSEDQSGDERQLPPGRTLHRHAKSVTFDVAPPQVNEYELTTPDISSIGTGSRENSYDSAEEEEDSYNLGDSMDQDDSFDASLEDTDKTPVVGPEDWRHTSPQTHRQNYLGNRFDDPFEGPEGSPMPDAQPSNAHSRPNALRTDSLNSNGEHRPLPPLPGANTRRYSASPSVSTNTSPIAPASASKSDILGFGKGGLSLEEKLRMMMIQDEEKPKTQAELQRERRLRRGGNRSSQTPEREQSINVYEDEDTLDDLPVHSFKLPERISRESILRKIGTQDTGRESDYNFSSPPPSSSPERPAAIDPDTPLPTIEDRSVLENDLEEESSVIIKPEPESDDEIDVYQVPELYSKPNMVEPKSSGDASGSQESNLTETNDSTQRADVVDEEEEVLTPRQATSPTLFSENITDSITLDNKNSLPDFSTFLSNEDFGLGMQSYMTPSPPLEKEAEVRVSEVVVAEQPKNEFKGLRMSDAHEFLKRSETPEESTTPKEPSTPEQARQESARPEYDGAGWGSDDEDEFEIGTPDSVIRHPMPPSPIRESPAIPEQIATIKSSGSKLKTRPSATPSDLMAMREQRRMVSGEVPNIPPIPQRHRNRPSSVFEPETSESVNLAGDLERQSSFKNKSLTLDIGGDLGSSLSEDFERLIEAQKVGFTPFHTSSQHISGSEQALNTNATSQAVNDANRSCKQRGYLMRQNTKVVVASSSTDKSDGFHTTRSAGNSPVKQERPHSWVVEPWNGQQRKPSYRDRSNPRKKPAPGVVPPLPGHESNATAGLGMVSEESVAGSAEDGERGRLFVKVIGVKDLDLPLPRNEQSWFSLTLDNGVHCVTTAWLELGRNAPIGQEFELVVPNELEFQLTLNAKLVKPAPKRVVESPTKTHKAQKPSTFSRVFMSPKKRKELESQAREEELRVIEQNKREAAAKRASQQPTTWDLLSPLAAEDGSFGRAYICLKDHETRCFGRPYVVDIACYNEWATEDASYLSSMKSKRGNTVVQKRAPYKVGNLELQLLFVPKPKGATDEEMPKSMNSCIREMKEAEVALSRVWEGYLSQQGGDCPYWRRRYFKLNGSKLTAYHESTRQPRATINLANASKLIEDRRSLTQKETTGKGGKRRKSGFAEEEEGYMFVEEGFRIRFSNGEIIDFYADNRADKDGWVKNLEQCIGREGSGSKGGWCDLVLKREESLRKAQPTSPRKTSHSKSHARTKSGM